jgi:DNA-binding XRE family transcriptional regulator
MKSNRISALSNELWDRLVSVLRQDPKTQADMAKEIDISLTAYKCFINGQRDSSFKTLSKIEKYVIKREKELNGM